MAWTKHTFYLSILVALILVFVGLSKMGEEAAGNPNIDLSEDSIDYILKLKGVTDNSSYTSFSETSSYDTANSDPLESDDNRSVSEEGDFLSTLYIKKERASKPTTFFKLIFNIPTTILISLRLPLDPFTWVTNTINAVIFIALIILAWVYFIRP